VIPAAALGALTALGLVTVWVALHPGPEPLSALLGRLGRPLPSAPARGAEAGGAASRLGARLERSEYGHRYVEWVAGDLRVLGHHPADEITALVVAVVSGATILPVVAVAAAVLLGPRLPPTMVVLLSPLVGVALAARRVVSLRRLATGRRDEFRASLAAFCDLTAMNLAAGRGVSQALETAAQLGAGRSFTELRAALVGAHERGAPPADGLERLGVELGVDDLVEVAGSIRLAGSNGAAVRTTLNHKATTIRDRLTAQAERRAARVTERMGLPAAAVLMGLVAFYIYPVIDTLLNP
jgi:tight adherence protein C